MGIVLGLPMMGFSTRVINLGIRKKACNFVVSWAVFNFIGK